MNRKFKKKLIDNFYKSIAPIEEFRFSFSNIYIL